MPEGPPLCRSVWKPANKVGWGVRCHYGVKLSSKLRSAWRNNMGSNTIRPKGGKAPADTWRSVMARLLGRLRPYLWVLPAVVFFVLFIGYPVCFAFRLALVEWPGIRPIKDMRWVGLENYRELFQQDEVFRLALRNSIFYAMVTTLAFSSLGFLLAFALWYKPPRLAGFLRSVIFYPSILSSVIISLAWFKMYAMDGLVNGILTGILGQPVEVMWLGNLKLCLLAVMWVDIWKNTGWTMVLYLAGMSAVSRELVESALLDGAGAFQLARHIVAPMIRNVNRLAILLNIIGGLKVFGPVWVMTEGGPLHRTEVLSTYSYWLAFSREGPLRMGYAAAVTSVGVVILFVMSVMRLRLGKTE